MNERDIFNALVRNAFDFLNRAIKEFDKDPKFSVIHFCAAVEMLLKARLLKEHWSLIVAKPELANRSKFISGNFTSVSMDEARTRIRDIAGEDIGNVALASFRGVAKHRNKLIHFFHADMENDIDAKEEIIAEHCRAWFHLHRLLNQWKEFFEDFAKEIKLADKSMKKHRKYLSKKFDAIKHDIDELRKAGSKFRKCNACGFKSALVEEFDDEIADVRCLVCDHRETQVRLGCPHCGKPTIIANEGWGTCTKCGSNIEPDDVAGVLADAHAEYCAMKDGDDFCSRANCDQCDGEKTVVYRNGGYFCCQCFVRFDSTEQCEWCGEMSTGNMEDSYLMGCSCCEGYVEYHKDE